MIGTSLLAAVAIACGEGGPPVSFLSLGTGGTGGIYYPLGGGIAARLSARDSTRRFPAEVTGGSVENVNRVAAGQIDLGFALAVTAYEAFHGLGDYETPVSDLRILAPLYPNMVHVLVRESGPIRRGVDRRG